MPTAEQNTVSLKTSVFGLLDEAPMTPLHYCYWLLASGGTLLDGFSVVALGIHPPPQARHDDYSSTDRPDRLSPGAWCCAWGNAGRHRGGSNRPQACVYCGYGNSGGRLSALRSGSRPCISWLASF